MVLTLNNELTGSRRLVYTYKKYKKHYHAWSCHIFYPIRSQNEIFFTPKTQFLSGRKLNFRVLNNIIVSAVTCGLQNNQK